MIRLLIIGRPGVAWAQRIRETLGEAIDLDTAQLPSAGIRQFEATPADVIFIADERGGDRVETLIQAIRNRPLGRLIPIVLAAPMPEASVVDEKMALHELLGWLPTDASVHQLWRLIDEGLGLSESLQQAPSPSPSVFERGPDHDPLTTHTGPKERLGSSSPALLLEPVDEPAVTRQPPRSLFPGRTDFQVTGSVDGDAIERKLKDVRHQDYYAILEIRRGAESQTVREAFHRLMAKFDSRAMDFEVSHRYQNELAEIGDALEDAWAVLGDPDLRQPYLTHTLRK
jgi:hypothetical protein